MSGERDLGEGLGEGGVGGGGVGGWDGTGRTSDRIGAAGVTSGETAPMDLSPGFLYFSSRTAPSELRRSPPPTLKKKRLLREDRSLFLHTTSLTSPSVPVVLPDHSVYDLETSEEKNI